jgi:hypothetical protein
MPPRSDHSFSPGVGPCFSDLKIGPNGGYRALSAPGAIAECDHTAAAALGDRLCVLVPCSRQRSRCMVQYARPQATSAVTLRDHIACDSRPAVASRLQIIPPLDVQIARAAPARGTAVFFTMSGRYSIAAHRMRTRRTRTHGGSPDGLDGAAGESRPAHTALVTAAAATRQPPGRPDLQPGTDDCRDRCGRVTRQVRAESS